MKGVISFFWNGAMGGLVILTVLAPLVVPALALYSLIKDLNITGQSGGIPLEIMAYLVILLGLVSVWAIVVTALSRRLKKHYQEKEDPRALIYEKFRIFSIVIAIIAGTLSVTFAFVYFPLWTLTVLVILFFLYIGGTLWKRIR